MIYAAHDRRWNMARTTRTSSNEASGRKLHEEALSGLSVPPVQNEHHLHLSSIYHLLNYACCPLSLLIKFPLAMLASCAEEGAPEKCSWMWNCSERVGLGNDTGRCCGGNFWTGEARAMWRFLFFWWISGIRFGFWKEENGISISGRLQDWGIWNWGGEDGRFNRKESIFFVQTILAYGWEPLPEGGWEKEMSQEVCQTWWEDREN